MTKQQALARLRTLIGETWANHRDPDSAEHNGCEEAECLWCEDTRKALAVLEAPDEPKAEPKCSSMETNGHHRWIAKEGYECIFCPAECDHLPENREGSQS